MLCDNIPHMPEQFNVQSQDLGAIQSWLESAQANPDTYTSSSSVLTDAVTGKQIQLVPPAALNEAPE